MNAITKILFLVLTMYLHGTPTEGCTDIEAINYNSNATYGENQCWYEFNEYQWTVSLMSFYGTHPDNSLINMVSSLETAYQIIGQGVASQEVTPFNWIGSIMDIDQTKGYWIVQAIPDYLSYIGQPINPSIEYCLSTGNNLISYPNKNPYSIINAFPEEILNNINQIATSGYAAIKDSSGQWHGSLETLNPWKGYWLNSTTSEEVCFQFNNSYPLPRETIEQVTELPEEMKFNQSTKQSFYFIQNNNQINNGDYIVAKKGDVVVGSTRFTGKEYSTLPIMGTDGNWYSDGYLEDNDNIVIEIWNQNNKFTGNLVSDSELKFKDLNLEFINSYTIQKTEPISFELISAYPNPFNPAINIELTLLEKSKVNIDIFDINGIFIKGLVDSYVDKGTYKYVWYANNYPSGIYLLKLDHNNTKRVKKISLIK